MSKRRTAVSYYDDYDEDDDLALPERSAARSVAPPRGAARPGLVLRLIETALARPVHTAGLFISAVAVGAVAVNAMSNQPQRHPSPLFSTRNYAVSAASAPPPVAQGAIPQVVQPPVKPPAPQVAAAPPEAPLQTASLKDAQPRAKPPAMTEPNPVTRDLQALMSVRGFYRGDVDGLYGTSTADGIRLLEKSLGLAPTGEVSERLLMLARERTLAVPVVAPNPAAPIPPKPIVERPEARAVPMAAPAPAPKTVVAAAPAVPAAKPASISQLLQGSATPAPAPVAQSAAIPVHVTDDRTVRIQKALANAGYGPLKPSGQIDDKTGEAIRRYEKDHGLPQTGRISDRLALDLMAMNGQ